MNKLFRIIKRLFRYKPKEIEISFPAYGELSDEEIAWLFGEKLNEDCT